MKLAFSNIAWTPHDRPDVLGLMRSRGVTGIEIAPTKVWPGWRSASAEEARKYSARLGALGFSVPAMQAVLFDKPDARLFDRAGEAVLMAHLVHVAEIAQALGARSVVLGAPRQRNRGDLSMSEAMNHATPLFRELGEEFAKRDTCLCIEPNPRRYACNFIVNATEGAELVRRVNHPGFGLHLDAAAMYLENDDVTRLWPEIGRYVRHFHISEPDLRGFTEPQVPHRENLRVLMSAGYSGWFSVEMREPTPPLALVGPWSVLEGIHD